ncbi:hypothetical protein [uncultured Paracoccus sp.]|uniref:hypothetical protein n=1 Tax=uncultured Paracoccus sp. TaxID=189685 RepID=UPI00262175C3|nr:hypothetical protein [uncultured Paracoccus sp.]
MPRYRTRQRSILPYLVVAGLGALAAWAMNRSDYLSADQQRRVRAGGAGGSGPSRRHFAAISPKAAAEADDAADEFVRPAGQDAMRDPPRGWDSVDEMADESFPASDPPANY